MNGTQHDIEPAAGQLALLGLVVVQLFLGYEWFMSGLTKIWRGGFPGGLADELKEKSEGTVGWYKSFLDGSVIPNARAFGYLSEIGELLIGIVIIGTAVAGIGRRTRLSDRARLFLLVANALALVGAIAMNINFHLANCSPHPWLIPEDGFDEGVDLDSLLPLLQLVLLVISVKLAGIVRRRMTAERESASTSIGAGTETPAPS